MLVKQNYSALTELEELEAWDTNWNSLFKGSKYD